MEMQQQPKPAEASNGAPDTVRLLHHSHHDTQQQQACQVDSRGDAVGEEGTTSAHEKLRPREDEEH